MALVSSTVAAAALDSSSISPSKNASSLLHNYHSATVSLRFSSKPQLPQFFTKGLQPSWRSSSVVRTQLNELRPPKKSELSSVEAKDSKTSNVPSPATLATEESISEFISQVASLVNGSRDIVVLQLKQLDCEVIIRKKEALPQPPSPPSMFMMHSPSPQSVMPQASPAPAPAPSAPAPSSAPYPPPSPSAAKSAKSSSPPLKCPMAGTFYRSPAPGGTPFVKVGDKVQKGQVVCIIEAMKLMNEIEADRSGTIVEIIAEDGKPVSIDTPLFVIEP